MELVLDGDPHGMTWLRPDFHYAEVRVAPPLGDTLESHVETERVGEEIRTTVTLTNASSRPVFTGVTDVAITLPLEDRYDDARLCATHRCHAHVHAGGSASYVLALRMGGQPPHLGVVLAEGELAGYSIERDPSLSSNDRGCLLLHPAPLELGPGESARLTWVMFACHDREDFARQALRRTRFVHAEWDRYVLVPGEQATLRVRAWDGAESATVGGEPAVRQADGSFTFAVEAHQPGELLLVVDVDGRTTRTRLLVKEPVHVLAARRCAFLADRQQYAGPIATLDGAFLTYDTEEGHLVYSATNDLNGGRERVGMGVLLATYLLARREGALAAPDPDDPEDPNLLVDRVRAALDRYVSYVRRELVDEATGRVFNDVGRDDHYRRLYNAPWFARFFLTLHELDGKVDDLLLSARILRCYYADGGGEFYPLELPALDLYRALLSAGSGEEAEWLRAEVLAHARYLAATGNRYPESEVNYEQSIVAPAADVLLQAHVLTGDPDLLAAAREQISVLDQFNGTQPDHHLHEVAIRHWDGYWFGKRRRLGDTFPHYWSGLTGVVLDAYAAVTGDAESARRADASLRGVLPLVHDDGSATCAHVFPLTVNGEPGAFDDPYANDQDWALVFTLRRLRARHRVSGGGE